MRGVLIVCIVLVVVAGVFGVVILYNASTNLSMTGSYTASSPDYLAASIVLVYLLLSALSLLGFALGVLNLIWDFFRLILRRASLFGEAPSIRWISLGAIILLMPDVPYNLLRALLSFVVYVLRMVPSDLYSNWFNDTYCLYNSSSLSQCLGSLSFDFLRSWTYNLGRAYDLSGLQSFRWERILFFFALWLLIGRVLSWINPDPPLPTEEKEANAPHARSKQTQRTWLQDGTAALRRDFPSLVKWWRDPDGRVFRQNLLFFLILALGTYLSIVSVIAIPALEESSGTINQMSPEALRTQITAITNARTIPDAPSPRDYDPFSLLRPYLPSDIAVAPSDEEGEPGGSSAMGGSVEQTPEAVILATATPMTDEEARTVAFAARLQYPVTQYHRDRLSLYDKAVSLREQTDDDLAANAELISSSYSINIPNRPGQRENGQYYLRLISWYQERIRELDEQIEDCDRALHAADLELYDWSGVQQDIFFRSQSGSYGSTDMNQLYEAFNNADSQCSWLPPSGAVPDRPTLGENWGVFGQLASPLLRAESLDLVLLVGLFGFGLVGSASSTYIREQATGKARRNNGALVKDLTGVMLRGVTAAFVVFVAATAGLAVFSSGDSTPRPYSILLFCLIGAVFSETIWDWARKQLLKSFGTEPQDLPLVGSTSDSGTASDSTVDAGSSSGVAGETTDGNSSLSEELPKG